MNLVNYAIRYAEKGFSVIPIQDKKPMMKFANKAPMTVKEIKDFWFWHPEAEIALKTDKFFVIDCDNHEGQPAGIDELKKLKHDDWFKNTLTETTKHGGFHFYFQKPKDVTMTQVIGILPSVDLKANNNNYVVVAPSQGYEFINKEPMKIAPKGLMDWINKSMPNYSHKLADWIKSDSNHNATTDLFETIANGLGDNGMRNNNLTKFVGGLLLRKVAVDDVIKLAKIANQATIEPLSSKEFDTTVNSIIESEVNKCGIKSNQY